jgi:hypothetical protein
MKESTGIEGRETLIKLPVASGCSSEAIQEPRLTYKQREFARQVALGKSKAEAYRASHRRDVSKATLRSEPYSLARNPVIAHAIDAYSLALEAEKHKTPGRLKALLVQQLVQHALDPEFPPAQRVQCLKLLGSLFEVKAFTEHKTVETVKPSKDIRARLIETLQEVTEVDTDDIAQFLEEIHQSGREANSYLLDSQPSQEAS